MEITGLLLSAGLSSRMGENKALLPYYQTNFISEIISKLQNLCTKIIVVTGYQHETIIKSILDHKELKHDKIKFIKNFSFDKGMFTSLQTGISQVKTKYILYHFVDNPSLPLYFYEQFLEQIIPGYNWFQPLYEGKKGHPIIFDDVVSGLILDAGGNTTLKTISLNEQIKKFYWNCSFKEILNDIDTPEDYRRIKIDEHIRKDTRTRKNK